MSTTSIIELQNIHYTYPAARNCALEGASMRITQGDAIGLIGHNGCGKTTLFHIIMGLITPHQGVVLFKGEPVKGEKAFQPLRKEVGLLFQQSDDQLFSPTVLEDVAFGPLNLGKTAQEARTIAEETLERVGFAHLAQRVTHRLSGGEKKMVALASVLAMHPRVLLLDEPTNDLDPHTREHLIEVLTTLNVTRLIISHDWDFLDRTCTSFLTMKNGAVTATDHVPHVHVHTHEGGDAEHVHKECL